MTYPEAGLALVKGAELIDRVHNGRIEWVGGNWREPGLRPWRRAWRYVNAQPVPLGQGEKWVLATKLHWAGLIRTVTEMGVMWPVLLIANMVVNLFETLLAVDVWWLRLAGIVAMGVHQTMMLHKVLFWRAQRIVVTSHRLIRTRGVFGRYVEEVKLHQLTSLTWSQEPHERALGYGTLRIESGGYHDDGAKREKWPHVPDPEDVWAALNQFPVPLWMHQAA